MTHIRAFSCVTRFVAFCAILVTAAAAGAQTAPNYDVDRDGVVTQADVTLVRASLNRSVGQAGFNPNADVNASGRVDNTDLMLVMRNIGKRYPVPVPDPTIAAAAVPAANALGWNNTDVTVSFTCTNATACPAPVTVTTEGTSQVIARTVQNSAGVQAQAAVTLNIDKTPPVLNVTAPQSAAPGSAVQVDVGAADLSGLASTALTLDGAPASSRSTAPFDLTGTLPAGVPAGGTRVLEVTGVDRAGNAAVVTRLVQIVAGDTQAPTVSLSVPSLAAPGKQIPVTATARDDRGVVQLTLQQVADNQPETLAELTAGPFVLQRPFAVPDVPDGTQVVFTARATDAASNQGSISATVTVQRLVETEALTLQVDPTFSPTFQSSAVLTGRINSGVTSEVPPAPPFVAALTTLSGSQGDTIDVGITGANTTFNPATTTVTFGPGITVQSLDVLGEGELRVRIAIDAKASLGPRLVAVSTGREEALLPNAFFVVSGLGGVSGRLVTTATGGAPIANGEVCAPATARCTTTAPDGTFALADVPTAAGRITASAPGFTGASVPIVLGISQSLALGDITLAPLVEAPPPPQPGAPILPGLLGSAVARMSIAFTEPQTLSFERARKLVLDSILLVGADELGAHDTDGTQLNPDVTGDGILTLTDRAVSLQARGLQQGVTTSLEELWFSMVMGFEWTDPGPPSLDAFVASLQARIDEAWAEPSGARSPLAILLFNQGAAFSKLAPIISRQTRVNSLQAMFIYLAPLLDAYHGLTTPPVPPPDNFASADTSNGPSWFTRALQGVFGSLTTGRRLSSGGGAMGSRLAALPSPAVGLSALRGSAVTRVRGTHSATTSAPADEVVSRRQLSRSLKDAAAGFYRNLAIGFAGNLLFGLPAAAASGGLMGLTVFTAAVGAMTDTLLFGALGVAIATKLAPPAPEIVSVAQVGNSVRVTIRRIPLDLRCRTELLDDPESTAGLCNFQYTLYRAGGGATKVVVSRLVPSFKEDDPAGVFTVDDHFPNVGGNVYYADVIQKFPMSLTPAQATIASGLTLPTRIGIPVGNAVSLFFLTELISDFSEPNPYPLLSHGISNDWDRVRVQFVPVPPTATFAFLRTAGVQSVYVADTGFNRIFQVAPGGPQHTINPSFGRPVGLTADAAGNVYAVNEQSQAQFGGRVFQFTPTGGQHFVGTVNKYSPLLDVSRPVNVAAIAIGPKSPGRDGAHVPGDIFVADNADRSVKRLITSMIPAAGIGALPAPGHGIFGAAAASPIVGQPYVRMPTCAGAARAIRDIAFDQRNNLWIIVGQELYRVAYDPATGKGTGLVAAADLNGGSHVPPVLALKVRSEERSTLSIPNKGRAFVDAEWRPCGGELEWTVSDSEVAGLRIISNENGTSRVELRGRKPGTVTLTARFQTPGGAVNTESMTVKVLETGPILFVHGWIGSGGGWQPVMDKLADEGLVDGGYLCARWVKGRGRFVRTEMFDGNFRSGNTAEFRCDDAAEDGAYFTLNFDDNQNRFIDTAGELSDIVDQITTAIGGEACKTMPHHDPNDPWPAECPRLTLVAHSMGGQTTRAFIQNTVHGGFTVGDWPPGASDVPSGGQRLGMPFRPFRNQVAKVVTLGTMNLGTPVPLLTQDQSLIFWGMVPLPVLKAPGAIGLDPFSSAILSMRVNSPELQLLNHNIANLKQLELVSIVTRAPANAVATACAALSTTATAAEVIATLKPSWLFKLITFIGGQLVDGFVVNMFDSLHNRFCGPGTTLDIPVYGSDLAPEHFFLNSDEIVGIDSQNINNLFRYLDRGGAGISYAFVNEPGLGRDATPGQRLTHPAPAKVVTVSDKLHTEDTAAWDVILPELDLDAPDADGNATPESVETPPSAETPAVAQIADPHHLAVDRAGSIFISDKSNGSVTVIGPGLLSQTFVGGITNLGPIAVQDGFLYASRGGDIVRVPLGVTGKVSFSDGTPARLAQITVRGVDGYQARTVTADAGGNFSVGLESMATILSGDQLTMFLTITTQATDEQPSRTVEVEVPIAVSDTGERTQTSVVIQVGS